jgi:hypothetical protein
MPLGTEILQLIFGAGGENASFRRQRGLPARLRRPTDAGAERSSQAGRERLRTSLYGQKIPETSQWEVA